MNSIRKIIFVYSACYLNIFSISETAPVRLASLRADRARVHWQGSQKLIENRDINSEGMKSHLSDSKNRLATRSVFQNRLFFV